jgi:DNA-binding MarR family transcriptional regulator
MIPKQLFVNEMFKLVAILENTWDFIFSQVGLTVKTYAILYLISTGITTSKDLLNGSYGSKPNMTKKIKMLEDNGFVQRKIDQHDKRIFRFTITKKAEKNIQKIGPIYEKNIAMIFEWITNKEVKIGFELISRCLENLKNKQKI